MTAPAEASQPSGPGYAKHPGYQAALVPCAKRVRVAFNGATLADSTATLLVRETGRVPVYYFPKDDLRLEHFVPSDRRTACPFKGEAAYWTVTVGERQAENAVWGYDSPYREVAGLAGYRAFFWGLMDHWYEEDEEVFVHARDPFVQIDVLDSSRPVQVRLGGEIVAESHRPRFLFETGLPTRYYLPAEDVRQDFLTPSDTVSACPYKGEARYWAAHIGDQVFEDIVWSYPDPLPEVGGIKDRLCFFDERVDAVLLDGVEQPKPRTKWS